MHPRIAQLLIGILLLSLPVACQDNRTFNSYKHIKIGGWARNDTVMFNIPRQWEGHYSMELDVRATYKFPYRSISMIVEQQIIPANKHHIPVTSTTDTINCRIFDNNGNMLARNGIFTSENTNYLSSFHLNRGDSLRLTITHIMSRDELPGISEIGLCLSRIMR